MKIKVIIPNSSITFRESQVEQREKPTTPGVSIDIVCLPNGPESIESAYDEALAAPYIISEVEKAAKEGYDAVTLDCAMDTVVRAARESVKIPVISAGEASHLLALGLCRKYSIITVLHSTAEAIIENLNKEGLSNRIASVRAAKIPVLELDNNEMVFDKICVQANLAIREDGAQAIVLGCTGMFWAAERLKRELGIPVIDPGAAAVKLAEVYVSMGLSSSSIAYGRHDSLGEPLST